MKEADIHGRSHCAGARELGDHEALFKPGDRQAPYLAWIHARADYRSAANDKPDVGS